MDSLLCYRVITMSAESWLIWIKVPSPFWLTSDPVKNASETKQRTFKSGLKTKTSCCCCCCCYFVNQSSSVSLVNDEEVAVSYFLTTLEPRVGIRPRWPPIGSLHPVHIIAASAVHQQCVCCCCCCCSRCFCCANDSYQLYPSAPFKGQQEEMALICLCCFIFCDGY